MKHLYLFLLLKILILPTFGQMIMSAEGVTPENACNPNKVYFLMERKARPIEKFDLIESRLNEMVSFAKDNPDFVGSCSIQFVVNCNGQIGGGFHVVKKSGNEKLDLELIDFIKTVEDWRAGKRNKKKTVDSWYMWRLEIENGKITILNK